ncbi:hypothetical protein M9435_004003 [Picochlorum sp. BPE23]|nr:hypothetical protein M9435_004003 [Picochlorum sp. BPE23]
MREIQQSVCFLVLCCLLLQQNSLALAGKDIPPAVTCGSIVKLKNEKTGHVLHSIDVNYGTGSGQQAVIGSTASDSADSMWIVRSGSADCRQGTPIKQNQLIRLQHVRTAKWLHSHLFQSPLSGQQEISCFGSAKQSDTGDVWSVEWDDGKKTSWLRDMPVRLKHKDTGRFLSNHGKTYPRPIQGHSEVFGSSKKGKEQLFRAGDGVYFAERET